jgi:hypothetical protein
VRCGNVVGMEWHTQEILGRLAELLDRVRRVERQVEALGKESKTQTKAWYTVAEFAALVDRSEDRVRKWCSQGRIQAKKNPAPGRGGIPEWRIPRSELLRYQSEGLLPDRADGG